MDEIHKVQDQDMELKVVKYIKCVQTTDKCKVPRAQRMSSVTIIKHNSSTDVSDILSSRCIMQTCQGKAQSANNKYRSWKGKGQSAHRACQVNF